MDTSNWAIKYNCNALFSNIDRNDTTYIGVYKNLDDLIDYLNTKSNIVAFVWHTNDLEYESWQGKAYALTEKNLLEKNIVNNNSWKQEMNVVSAIRIHKNQNRYLYNCFTKEHVSKILNHILITSKTLFVGLMFTTSYFHINKELTHYNITRI